MANSIEPRLIEIARKYCSEKFPDDKRLVDYEAVVVEVKPNWVVFFRPKGQVIPGGGTPEIYINEKTLEVVDVKIAM